MVYKNCYIINPTESSVKPTVMKQVTNSTWGECFQPTITGSTDTSTLSYILEKYNANASATGTPDIKVALYSRCGHVGTQGYFKAIKIKNNDVFMAHDESDMTKATITETIRLN